MTNQPIPPFVPAGGDDADRGPDEALDAAQPGDADRPLDPDLDDDQIESAAADEQAASEGTLESGDEE